MSAIEDLLQKMKIAKEPWTTGYRPEEFPMLLAGVGLDLSADVGWQECMDQHLVPKGRNGIPLKMERLVTAAATTGKRPW